MDVPMTDATTIIELDERIAAVRQNIRELVKQLAAYSGAKLAPDLMPDRVASQYKLLAELLKEREVQAGSSRKPG
jgi:hypothetical protein